MILPVRHPLAHHGLNSSLTLVGSHLDSTLLSCAERPDPKGREEETNRRRKGEGGVVGGYLKHLAMTNNVDRRGRPRSSEAGGHLSRVAPLCLGRTRAGTRLCWWRAQPDGERR